LSVRNRLLRRSRSRIRRPSGLRHRHWAVAEPGGNFHRRVQRFPGRFLIGAGRFQLHPAAQSGICFLFGAMAVGQCRTAEGGARSGGEARPLDRPSPAQSFRLTLPLGIGHWEREVAGRSKAVNQALAKRNVSIPVTQARKSKDGALARTQGIKPRHRRRQNDRVQFKGRLTRSGSKPVWMPGRLCCMHAPKSKGGGLRVCLDGSGSWFCFWFLLVRNRSNTILI
jgi:hypothetical protein